MSPIAAGSTMSGWTICNSSPHASSRPLTTFGSPSGNCFFAQPGLLKKVKVIALPAASAARMRVGPRPPLMRTSNGVTVRITMRPSKADEAAGAAIRSIVPVGK